MRIPLGRYLTLLKAYLRPQWRAALLLALTLLIGIVLQLFNPQILGFFIDTAIHDGATSTLIGAGVLFIGMALLGQGLTVVSTYLATSIAWTATNQLRVDLVEHCLGLDQGFFKTRSAGEMIERIDGDVNTLSNFFSKFVVDLLSSAVLLLGVLVLFFVIDWRVGIAMVLFCIFVFFALSYMRKRAVPLWKEVREAWTRYFGFLSESLTGTEDIRANGAIDYILRNFYQRLQIMLPVLKRARNAGVFMSMATLFLFICGSALSLSMGIYLWSLGQISVGIIYQLFAYTDLIAQPLQKIQEQFQDLQQAEASMVRIEELLVTRSALPEGVGAEIPDGPLSVSFEQVTFGYNDGEPIVKDIALELQAGRVLGILGRTGSGKTTLARLVFRLYDPQQGTIRLSGVPIRQPYLRELRQRIGMVSQDVQLFQASVRDNLTLFNRGIADERIVSALTEAGLLSWYQALEKGLDTILGTAGQGVGLSAGQAQLLAFTRVLLTNPGLVILDEASSRLDPATERLVEQAINKLFAGRTALVIAHRLATLQHVDEILIIEDGQIIESGPRAQLANDPHSHFANLLRTGQENGVFSMDSMEVLNGGASQQLVNMAIHGQ